VKKKRLEHSPMIAISDRARRDAPRFEHTNTAFHGGAA